MTSTPSQQDIMMPAILLTHTWLSLPGYSPDGVTTKTLFHREPIRRAPLMLPNGLGALRPESTERRATSQQRACPELKFG